mmetsp:Transcript_43669/g.136612  ORF Transcript_43669/g.136612 Transcript_43669/m.136612 type:complete len:400 (-) Transcript_43669:443-1642(-)
MGCNIGSFMMSWNAERQRSAMIRSVLPGAPGAQPARATRSLKSCQSIVAANFARFSSDDVLATGLPSTGGRSGIWCQHSSTPLQKPAMPSPSRRSTQYTVNRAPIVRWYSTSPDNPDEACVWPSAGPESELAKKRDSSGKLWTQSSKNSRRMYLGSRIRSAIFRILPQSAVCPAMARARATFGALKSLEPLRLPSAFALGLAPPPHGPDLAPAMLPMERKGGRGTFRSCVLGTGSSDFGCSDCLAGSFVAAVAWDGSIFGASISLADSFVTDAAFDGSIFGSCISLGVALTGKGGIDKLVPVETWHLWQAPPPLEGSEPRRVGGAEHDRLLAVRCSDTVSSSRSKRATWHCRDFVVVAAAAQDASSCRRSFQSLSSVRCAQRTCSRSSSATPRQQFPNS